jgi:hypothetical protein
MIPRASASSAVTGMFSDCRIWALDVRRNGLQAFSNFSVVGICPNNTYSLGKSKRRRIETGYQIHIIETHD